MCKLQLGEGSESYLEPGDNDCVTRKDNAHAGNAEGEKVLLISSWCIFGTLTGKTHKNDTVCSFQMTTNSHAFTCSMRDFSFG
jgi:hypothetical protein